MIFCDVKGSLLNGCKFMFIIRAWFCTTGGALTQKAGCLNKHTPADEHMIAVNVPKYHLFLLVYLMQLVDALSEGQAGSTNIQLKVRDTQKSQGTTGWISFKISNACYK